MSTSGSGVLEDVKVGVRLKISALRGFAVAMVDGRSEFRRPDGTPLEHRGPPVRVVV